MRDHIGGIGVQVLFLIALGSCARETTRPVPLPPLDAPRPSLTVDTPGAYRLQPGDTLRVKFLYHPELDIKVPVRPDGNITLQVAGQIHAAGMTTGEVEEVIKERSSARLREPDISVIVADVAVQRIYVGGEVRVPGFVTYNAGMTPLQAILDRGGFTDVARVDSVLRLSASQNEYQGTRLDLTKSLAEGANEQTQLAAGDVLFVPRTFVGDVNTFVRLYIREMLPIQPRVGAGTSF